MLTSHRSRTRSALMVLGGLAAVLCTFVADAGSASAAGAAKDCRKNTKVVDFPNSNDSVTLTARTCVEGWPNRSFKAWITTSWQWSDHGGASAFAVVQPHV